MNRHILIGHIANYYGISKQALIHYDRIGLLKPSLIKDNGYRYYSYEDVDKLDLIISLKDAGLSLKEIQAYLKEPSLERSIDILQQQQGILEQRLKTLHKTSVKLKYKVEELEYIASLDLSEDVRIVEKEERYILKTSIDTELDYELAFPDAMSRLNKLVEEDEKYYKYYHYTESVILSLDAIEKGDFASFKDVCIFINHYNHQAHEVILPKGLYACIYHHGPYEETKRSYDKLFAYLEQHDYEIIGDSIEIPTITAWAAAGEQDYVTEIQIPIQKAALNNSMRFVIYEKV